MKLEFVIAVAGVPKGRPRFTRTGRTYTPRETVQFERLVASCARVAMSKAGARIIEKRPLDVAITFYYEPPASWAKRRKLKVLEMGAVPKYTKPDTDNLQKAILDGMNNIVYGDDAIVSDLSSSKRYSYADANTVHVCVSTIEEYI